MVNYLIIGVFNIVQDKLAKQLTTTVDICVKDSLELFGYEEILLRKVDWVLTSLTGHIVS